jgi:hypothetical protein
MWSSRQADDTISVSRLLFLFILIKVVKKIVFELELLPECVSHFCLRGSPWDGKPLAYYVLAAKRTMRIGSPA